MKHIIIDEAKNKLYILLANMVVLTIFWGGLLRKSFNADTITYMVYTKDDIPVQIRDGRYLVALYDFALAKLGTSSTEHIPLFLLFSLIFFALTATTIQILFRKYLKTDNLFAIAGFYGALGLCFTNVLFAEYLFFPEVTLPYSIGFFVVTMGICFFAKGKRAIAFLFFLIGACTYQMTLIYSAIILAFYYMLQHQFKWSVRALIDEFTAVITSLGAGVVNVLIIKLVEFIFPDYAYRKSVSSGALLGNVPKVFESCREFLKNSFTLLPSVYLPTLITVVFMIGILFAVAKTVGRSGILFYICVMAGALMILFIFPLLGDGDSFSFPPRMSFGFYLIQGLMAVTFMATVPDSDMRILKLSVKKEYCLELASIVIVGYLWAQMLFVSFIIPGRFVSNALDTVYAKMIMNEIEKYEEQTGNVVYYFETIGDGYAPAYYDESWIHYDQINGRVIGQATRTLLEAVEGRVFESRGDFPEDVYTEYFKDKDWDTFDLNEQLVIIGDTAYLCVY